MANNPGENILQELQLIKSATQANLVQTARMTTVVAGISVAIKDIVNTNAFHERSSEINLETESTVQRPMFHPAVVTNKQQLDSLESSLSLTSNAEALENWLKAQMQSTDKFQRIHESFYNVFCRQFVVQCNWRGVSRNGSEKVALVAYRNFLNAFKRVGGA